MTLLRTLYSRGSSKFHRFAGVHRTSWLTFLLVLPPLFAWAGAPTLMRYPNSHDDRIVFVAHGNLWTVPVAGGTAQRLTSDPGQDMMPRYSPDGRWIAFTASYQGSQDVYVIPASGGEAKRLTFYSQSVTDNLVVTWTPDSRAVVFLSRNRGIPKRIYRLYQVPVEGGPPTPLPLDRGGLMTYGPDGHSIAYNRIFVDFATWKRYDGGQAQDVYTYDFDSKHLERITDWKGKDTAPMWVGRRIYFLSDRDENRRANLWVYDQDTKQTRAVTHFRDYDIDFPSYGDQRITFQQGGKLWAVDLPSEQLREVRVEVPDDGTRTMPRTVKVQDAIREEDTDDDQDYALSPNGERAVFCARGDLYTVPAQHGAIRNLTESSHAEEDHPAWSSDGRTIAYTTDVTGEQQVAMRPAAGGPETILTHFKTGFFYLPVWSPDGKTLAVWDGNHRLWLVPTDGTEPKQVAYNQFHVMHEVHEHDVVFSTDSQWLAFSTMQPNQQRAIHLCELKTGKDSVVSSPMNSDYNPAFSPDGTLLYFVSDRHELPTYSARETNIALLKPSGIYVATLTGQAPSPFAPQSDEGASSKKPDHPNEGASSEAPGQPVVRIDLEGLMQRAVPLPIPPGDIAAINTRGNKVFYATHPSPMLAGDLPGEKSAVHAFDMKARKDEVIVEGTDTYSLSADGARVLYKQGQDWHVADATGGHGSDKVLKLDGMRMRVDPRQEWAEMFENAWRLERDLFFSSVMNGNDWRAVHDNYARLVPLVGTRDDLNYVIGQMLGELGSSHTYVGGGDNDDNTTAVPTALLGVDYQLDEASGSYRFAKIYRGDNTRKEYRSPLTEPGINVHAGDYLLAVNGHELKAPATPDSLLVGVEGPVSLTVAPASNGPTREILVEPLKSEASVREQDWIDHNRERVNRLSGGRVGYVYVSDMQSLGMEQFVRQFYPQLTKQALVIDERWNNGGNTDQIVLERLRRVLVGMQTTRDRVAQTQPDQVLAGPKVMLINHYCGSDGDVFPFYFRAYGLGKLIGTRTWGGVRGIRTFWSLLDGGYITVPEIAFYDLEGHWVIENHGVDPDIEVEDVPGEYLDDHDIQLETGVKTLLDELARQPRPVVQPPPLLPAYPEAGIVRPSQEPATK